MNGVESMGRAVDASAAVQPAEPAASRWSLVAVLGVFALVMVLYWPSLASLASHWEDTASLTYTHGYLVAAIVVWLVFRARRELARIPIGPSPLAAAGTTLLSLAWLIAYRAGIEIGHQLLLPVIALAALYAVLGRRFARSLAFPAGYFVFAIPVWNLGNDLLQMMSVAAVRVLLRVFGVPAYFEGNFVHVPSGVFEIAGGCSGLHFLIVGLALAALLGELQRDPWRNRMLLLLLIAVLAIAGNWIRILVIIVAGHLTDMQHFLIQVDHYYFGWAVFGFVLAIFLLLARRLPPGPGQVSRAVADDRDRPPARLSMGVTVAVLSLAVGPLWAFGKPVVASATADRNLPDGVPNWVGPLPTGGNWAPMYPGADAAKLVSYRKDGVSVQLFLATYRHQVQGKELVGYDNDLLGGNRWSLVSAGEAGFPTVRLAESVVVDADGNQALLWHTYFVGNRPMLRSISAQIWYGTMSLFSAPESGVLALRAECASSCDTARQSVADFFRASADLTGLHIFPASGI